MAIFFTLSGFLITSFLLTKPDVLEFLSRRLFRILPLAWLAMLVLIIAEPSTVGQATANLCFYSNIPPTMLLKGGEHLWSLCVEMQFYLGIALLFALLGRRVLLLLPILAMAITALRISNQA
jgi:peptidoglycan/LPS O-acetylase OafA/YrhL